MLIIGERSLRWLENRTGVHSNRPSDPAEDAAEVLGNGEDSHCVGGVEG